MLVVACILLLLGYHHKVAAAKNWALKCNNFHNASRTLSTWLFSHMNISWIKHCFCSLCSLVSEALCNVSNYEIIAIGDVSQVML